MSICHRGIWPSIRGTHGLAGLAPSHIVTQVGESTALGEQNIIYLKLLYGEVSIFKRVISPLQLFH